MTSETMRGLMAIVESADAERIRIHNAVRSLTSFARSRTYPQQNGRKPNGFWWAFDQDWHAYVQAEKPKGKKIGPSNYRVEIDPAICHLIRLITWDDILAFTIEFGTTPAPGHRFYWQSGDQLHYDPAQDDQLIKLNICRVNQIAWAKVAEQYDGIELPYYNRADRPYVEWLDIDWSVASGCAWKLDGMRLFHF